MAYAGLAALAMAAALAAWTLLTSRTPEWLAVLGVALLVLALTSQRSTTFGCLGAESSLASAQGHPLFAVVLAVCSTAAVLLAWRRFLRGSVPDEA